MVSLRPLRSSLLQRFRPVALNVRPEPNPNKASVHRWRYFLRLGGRCLLFVQPSALPITWNLRAGQE
jgi:hypothetical protein